MNNGDEVEILKGQFKGVIGKIINDDMFICSCCGQKPLSAQILTALYNCIIFINQLKQQANGKHSNI